MANEIDSNPGVAAQAMLAQVVQELSGLRRATEQLDGIAFFKNGVEQIYLKVILGSNSVEINVGGEKGTIDPRAIEASMEVPTQ